jgi:hypothetical protein
MEVAMFHIGQEVYALGHVNCYKCQHRWDTRRGMVLKIIRCWVLVGFEGGQVLGFLHDEIEPVLTEAMLSTEAA